VDVSSEFSNYYYDYECDPAPRIVKPPTFAATLNYAACAAQAARLWAPYDAEKAENYLKSAIEAYEAYEKYWYDYDDSTTIHPEMSTDCPKEELNETSQYAPMWQAKTGTPYADNEVKDDAYWAACEIFVSASEMGESETAKEYKAILSESDYALQVFSRLVTGESKDGEFTSFRWDQTSCAGSLSLALHNDLLSEEEAEKVKDSIVKVADVYVEKEKEQGYGLPYCYDGPEYYDPIGITSDIQIDGYRYGSNGMAATNAIVMAYAYDVSGDMKYIDGVAQTMDYLLGNNPLSFSYITGYGTYGVQSPHHKHWVNEINEDAPEAPSGVLVGGPSAELTDDYIRGLGYSPWYYDNISQRCYVDSWEAWSVNDAALDWNASLAWVVSFLQDESNASPSIEYGDANCDGKVTIADSTAILQALGNPDKYALSEKGKANADIIDNGGGISVADAIAIQTVDAKLADIKSFPMTQEEYNSALNK
jgi:endoglucanase